MIEKLNIETLGEIITEYKDGKPWTSLINAGKASIDIAEKLNEIIEELNAIEEINSLRTP